MRLWHTGRMRVAALLVACLVCGCGDNQSGAAGPDAGAPVDAAAADAGAGELSACGVGPGPRAVVLGENGDSDFIRVLRLEAGELHDDGVEFPADNPRRVAVRADGREALVAWGGFGDAYGVTVLSLDGASAELAGTIDLGTGQTPFGVAYGSDDHAVVVTAGPTRGTLIAIDRVDGALEKGPVMRIPRNWPIDVATRGDTGEIILARVDLLTDEPTEVFRVVHGAEGWAIAGEPAEIDPASIDIAVPPGGTRVLSPTADPDDPVGTGNLEAGGLLQVLEVDDQGGPVAGESLAVPGLSGSLVVAPSGAFAVMLQAVYTIDDQTGTPIVRTYKLVTVPLGEDGAPIEAMEGDEEIPALLFDGSDIARSGHLVLAVQRYQGEVPEDEEHPLTLWAQPSPGVWERCQTLFMQGAEEVAVAPN